VDTNVWIAASMRSSASVECAGTCLQWLTDFRETQDHLIVDQASFASARVAGNTVLQEIRQNLRPGDFGLDLLNRHFLARCLFAIVPIEYDDSGAVLPEGVSIPGIEPADRKWVALNLAHPDRPPIHNACDGDWIKTEADLTAAGVEVVHLCEKELRQQVLQRDRK
jgi:hypothetical protein